MLSVEVLADPAGLRPEDAAAWDAMADAAGLPLTASAWMLALGRHVQAGERCTLLLVRDGAQLVGVGPFSTYRWPAPLGFDEARVMGAGAAHRIEPLCLPGRRSEVAAALARSLADRGVASLALEGHGAGSDWPSLLAAGWPGRLGAALRHDSAMDAPGLDLTGGYDAWLARRTPKLRKQLRNMGNAVARRGGVVEVVDDPAALEPAIRAMFAVHRLRFASIEKETSLDAAVEAAAQEAAPALLAAGRLVLVTVTAGEEVVGAEYALRAGGHLSFWQGGYHPDWAKQSLGLVLLAAVAREAAERGVTRVDLGGGAHPYKLRLADPEAGAGLAWTSVHPRRTQPRVRARMAPKHLRLGARNLAVRQAARHPELAGRVRARLGR